MFEHLKQPRDVTKFNLMRGTTDFGELTQFNMYETGYSYLALISIPKFLDVLAQKNKNYTTLINNYKHIIEREFKGLDGLEDITTDAGDITDGITTIQVINKVTKQGGSSFSLNYQEKSGSIITRVHELYLSGIKDPRTQAKHYHGLIQRGLVEPGFENEVFTFLYFTTDNTMTQIEKAYYIVGAQPTKAQTSIYNSTKGEIGFADISVEFTGFPITSNEVDKKAKAYLDWLNNPANPDHVVLNSSEFAYTGVDKIKTR